MFLKSLNNDLTGHTVGLIVLGLLVLLVAHWKGLTRCERQFVVTGVILLGATTKLAPWTFVQGTPLQLLQFPWRLSIGATIFILIAAIMFIGRTWSTQAIKKATWWMPVLCLVFATSSMLSSKYGQTSLYLKEQQVSSYLATYKLTEYMPAASLNYQGLVQQGQVVTNNGHKLTTYVQKSATSMTVTFRLYQRTEVLLPFYAYQGLVLQNRHYLLNYRVNKGLAAITLPAGDYELTGHYVMTTGSLIGLVVTLVSLLWLLAIVVWPYRKGKNTSAG